jgi:hypothetical protein
MISEGHGMRIGKQKNASLLGAIELIGPVILVYDVIFPAMDTSTHLKTIVSGQSIMPGEKKFSNISNAVHKSTMSTST